jgi:hypothetical protein
LQMNILPDISHLSLLPSHQSPQAFLIHLHKSENNNERRGKSNLNFSTLFIQYSFYVYERTSNTITFSLTWINIYFFRAIHHVICTFNLPTEYNASGQEHIIDDEDKVKIKVDPMKMNLDDIECSQLEEIVEGWIKYITKAFRDANEKVCILFYSYYVYDNMHEWVSK